MTTPTIPNDKRSYSAAYFALELDRNMQEGVIKSVEGGALKADVITHQMGSHPDLWRQVGRPKYDDIKLQVGMSISEAFYTWIQSFFGGVADRRSGGIIAADFDGIERARRDFYDAMICELQFPKLDAADKNPAYISVTIAAARTRFAAAAAGKPLPPAKLQPEKLWTACNFELVLEGFDCAKVTKIDQFGIKMKVIEYQYGSGRDPIKVPGRIEFPNLVFYLPETDAGQFYQRVKDRVIDGVPAPDARATGSITMHDNGNQELCTISLFGCDISGVTPDKLDASSDEIKLVKVELIVERMEFKYAK